MGFLINTNVSALNAFRNATINNLNMDNSLNALSSGKRINKASDDASGMGISNQLSAQSKGLGQAIANANDGIGLIQTADGALEEYTNILKRVRVLSVQSANDTQDATSRSYIQKEVTALLAEADDIATSTKFNGKVLLDGTYSGGATTSATQNVTSTGDYVNPTVGYGSAINYNISSGTITAGFSVTVNGTTATTSTDLTTDGTTAGSLQEWLDSTGLFTLSVAASSGFNLSFTTSVANTTFQANGTELNDILKFDSGTIAGALGTITTTPASTGSSLKFHTGAYSNETQSLSIESMRTSDIVGTIDVTSQAAAETSVGSVDTALKKVADQRATLGAAQNKLESTIRNISVTQVNVESARSQIVDVDFASESAKFAKTNIIAQSGSYALSQANANQDNILRLFQ